MNVFMSKRGSNQGKDRLLVEIEAITTALGNPGAVENYRDEDDIQHLGYIADQFRQLARRDGVEITNLPTTTNPKKGWVIPNDDSRFNSLKRAINDRHISDGAYRLLQLLQLRCGRKDHCWPPESQLAADLPTCGVKTQPMSVKTVQRRLAELKASGYVEIIEPHQLRQFGYKHETSGNTYRLIQLSETNLENKSVQN